MNEQDQGNKLLQHLKDTYRSLWPQLKEVGDQMRLDTLKRTLVGRINPLLPDAPDEPRLKGRKYFQLPSGGIFFATKQSYLDFFKKNFQAEEIIELPPPKPFQISPLKTS